MSCGCPDAAYAVMCRAAVRTPRLSARSGYGEPGRWSVGPHACSDGHIALCERGVVERQAAGAARNCARKPPPRDARGRVRMEVAAA